MNHIAYVEILTKDLEDKMRSDLIAYESRHGIDVNYKTFALVLYDAQNEAIGVLNAYTAFAEIYINDIWVDNAHRAKGYGRQLIRALETQFKNKGYNNINLVTSAFQAPGFYEKCGFQLEFVRVNKKNPQLTKSFFVKFFEEEIETQGILQHS